VIPGMDSFQYSLRQARNLHADIGGIGYGPQRFAQIPLRLVALGNLLPFAREPDLTRATLVAGSDRGWLTC
jgi:hypothetical protein